MTIPAQQTVRPPQLDHAWQQGNLHQYIMLAEAFLRHWPQDSDTRARAIEAYCRLGLASSAKRLFAHGDLSQAQRRALAGMIPARDPRRSWSGFRTRFEQNLELFERKTGCAAALWDVWRQAAGRLKLYECTDGNWQVWREAGARSAWLPAFYPHNGIADAASLRARWEGQIVRPLLVNGLGVGNVVRDIFIASQETFLSFSPPMWVVEPSLVGWAVVMHLEDLRPLLDAQRVRVFAGERAWSEVQAALDASEPPSPLPLRGGADWPGEPVSDDQLVAAINRTAERHKTAQRDLYTIVNNKTSARDFMWWAKRMEDAGKAAAPLRVLGVTSRFTTVLQYSMRDALAAFEELGCQTRLYMEADDHSYFRATELLGVIQEFEPDLIVRIDHLAAEYQHCFPDGIPSVCWIQDRLPHLFREEAGRGVRRLEYVIGQGYPECLTQFKYPDDRFLPCVIPTNPRHLLDPDETVEDLAPYRCDVMYATNAFPSAERRLEEFCARYGAASREFATAAWEEVVSVARRAEFTGDYDYFGLAQRVRGRLGLEVTNEAIFSDLVMMLRSVADGELRLRTLRAATAWAHEAGGVFFLYGRGWEDHPEFGAYARGFVQHGVELGRAFRGAKIALHAGCNQAVHQRVLDGLCAGGFFLIDWKPSDDAVAINDAIARAAWEHKLTPPFTLTPDMLSHPQGQEYAEWLRLRGNDPDAGVLCDENMWANVKLEQAGLRVSGGGLWSCYRSVAFRGPDELHEKLTHYTRDEQHRRELAADMRAAVLRECTYTGLMQRVLRFITDHLNGRTQPLL